MIDRKGLGLWLQVDLKGKIIYFDLQSSVVLS